MGLNLDKTTWQRVKFGDVIDSITDRVDNPSEAGVDRYVGLEHLDPGVMTVQRWDSPDKVEAQKLRFQPGDVIFGRRRAYQKKVAVADFEGICSAHALVLRARPDKILPEFLPIFLSSDYFLDRAISISVGSLSPTINWRDLKVQEFDLPPLPEQKHLADLLWAVEGHSAAVSKAVEESEKVFLAFIRELVWHQDEFEKLGSFMSMDIDQTPVLDSEKYKTIGVLNRGRGILFRGDLKGSETQYKSLNLVKKNQVIYSKLKAFEGSICIVPEEADGYYVSQEFPTFTLNSGLRDEYFELFTKLPEFWDMLAHVSVGMGGRR